MISKYRDSYLFAVAAVLLLNVVGVHSLVEGLYCGTENCYDVLGVTRESTRSEIAKSYRNLARKHHPDVQGADVSKEEAERNFRRIATAYEVLRDDASREDYDYMLDNPEEMWAHYYRYYRRRAAPNVDIRLIVAVCITLISGVQYYSAWFRYESAIDYLTTQPKYRFQALEIAKRENLLGEPNGKKSKERESKEKEKERQQQVIREVIKEKMDIRGGYAKPDWKQILWVQLIILPYTIYQYIAWYARWVYRFNWRKEEYGDEEKTYLIKKYLKLSQLEFEALEDDTLAEYIHDLELWKEDNAKAWKEEKEEEMKRELATSGRHKAYRRYMKKGVGRLTFED